MKKLLVVGVIVLFIGINIVQAELILNVTSEKVIKNDRCAEYLSVQGERVEPQLLGARSTFSGVDQVINWPGDDVHPAIGRDSSGLLLAAFADYYDTTYWICSTDDGKTWPSGVGFQMYSVCPSLDYWGSDSRFFGTFLSYPTTNEIYLVGVPDPTNNYSYYAWSYEINGLHHVIDSEIACDNTQGLYNWGFVSFIGSKTPDIVAAPFVLCSDETLQLYENYSGCAHTMADIDHVTHKTYSVYDWNNMGIWKLLIWQNDFSDWNWPGASMYELEGIGNLECPAVAVYDDSLVIVAETDENGNKDIVCYYSSNGINDGNLNKSFVVATDDNERYPEISWVKDRIFVCTFVKNGNLYMVKTDDGGATWSEPWRINDVEGTVVEEYKTADISEHGAKVVWEDNRGEDIDIYINDGILPARITIEDIKGGFGVRFVLKNTGEIEADNVHWKIHFDGEILLWPPSKCIEGSIDQLDVGEEKIVNSGLVFGLGRVTIAVTASTFGGGTAKKKVDGLLFFIYVKLLP